MEFLNDLLAPWVQPTAAWPTMQWALLLAVAAATGHVLQRVSGLPKLVGYVLVGTAAGLLGLGETTWPLSGNLLFVIELGLAVALFEAGSRVPLRWFRHNPMVLVQSLAESVLTYAAVYAVLRYAEVASDLAHPLALLSVAASPAVLLRVASDLRASGPVTDRAITLATLNTLFVLALGSAMSRIWQQPEPGLFAPIQESLRPVLLVLGLSVGAGAILAIGLRQALKFMHPTSENTSVLLLALIAACAALASHFGGSAPLAALLGGMMLKQLSPRPWSWPRQLGTAGSMLTMLMFVLVSTVAAQVSWSLSILGLVALVVGTRALTKVVAVGAASWGSGASWRQALWTGCALWPMSATALLIASQFAVYAPQMATDLTALALPAILSMEVLGALMATFALRRAREAREAPAASQPRGSAPAVSGVSGMSAATPVPVTPNGGSA